MSTTSLLRIGSLLLLLSLVTAPGFANGTPAGTAITNQASVTYLAGSNSRTVTSNTVTMYVAHRVVGVFSPVGRSEGGVDNRTAYYPMTFTNTGNRADDFAISFNTNAGYTVSMVRDADGNGAFTSGEPDITTTGSLAADAAINLLIRVQIAAGRSDNEEVTITATLTSTAGNSGNIVVANPNAAFPFSITYTVRKPVMVFTATQSDVTSNASRIPGADVTYTMTLDNASPSNSSINGSASVTFTLDPNFHFVSATSGGVLGSPLGNGNGGTVTWTFPQDQLDASDPALTFSVVVEPEQVTNNGTGIAAGTGVTAMTTGSSTQTRVQYNDGNITYNQDNANSFAFTVGTATGVVITQVTPNGSADPTATVEYTYTLKNTGNATDGYNLTQANGTGDLDVAHVFATSAGGPSVTSISGIAQGATTNLYVRVTVPDAATDGQTIIRSLTAETQSALRTAPTGGAINSTDEVTTTVRSATVTIQVAGGASDIISGDLNGYPVPGTVMRWTVTMTNAGTGVANNISSSNVGPQNATNTFVPTSVQIDADGNGSFELTSITLPYNDAGLTATEAGGVLTVTFPSIPANNGKRAYRYNVTVR